MNPEMMKNNIEKQNLFLKPKMAFILVNLNTSRGYYPGLYLYLGATITTMTGALKQFKEYGLIKVSKVGRERKVELTAKGKKVVENLMQIKKLTDRKWKK